MYFIKKNNYLANNKIYGDAISETSSEGIGNTSWKWGKTGDESNFAAQICQFFMRGGYWWNSSSAGLFSFGQNGGNSNYYSGFRSVLVSK